MFRNNITSDYVTCILVPLSDFVLERIATPPARDTRTRATQQQVGDKGEQERHDDRLSGMKTLELNELIDQIHKETQKNDTSG